MAGERNVDRIAAADSDSRLDTVKTDAFPPGQTAETRSLVEMHRKIASRLLREKAPGRAFAELVLASREVPMTARLAAALVRAALQAGTEAPAIALLTSGLEETDGAERVLVRRQLVRLLRRTGDHERAREALVVTLAESPSDRRARQILNALLAVEGRWEELDASLEKEVKEALRRGALKRAARASLRRARLWGERLKSPARAALRYGQAAQYAEQAGELDTAFSLRLLWLRALRDSKAPERALTEAVALCQILGDRVGKGQRARNVVEASTLAHAPTADAPVRRITQVELVAAAEEAEAKGNKPEAAALLAAAVKEGPDPSAHRKLEAHYVARRAWRELAQYYRDRSEAAQDPSERGDALQRLAELLEDELHDGAAAAKVYGELVQATGDKRALAEQVRLLSMRADASGVRRALDEAVERAADPVARADALVARAEAAAARRELDAARADFKAALEAVPRHLGACAGLAEIAPQGDLAQVLALRDALAAAPRRQPGRAEHYRRLARLAEPMGDSALLKHAWTEVLAELPSDEEAQRKLGALARELGDHQQVAQLLRAQLEREPRGPPARRARIELVGLLERGGKLEEALAELRQAVRFEPGHKEAWLALADRLTERGQMADAGWALEQGASATEDEGERLRTWERLARFTRDALKDDEKAAVFTARAENMRKARAGAAPLAALKPAVALGGPLTIPSPPRPVIAPPVVFATDVVTDAGPPPDLERRETEEFEAVPTSPAPEPEMADEEWEGSTVGRGLEDEDFEDEGELLGDAEAGVELPMPEEDVLEVTTGDVEIDVPSFEEWVAPPGEISGAHHTEELPLELGDPDVPVPPSIVPPVLPQHLTEERERLFQRVRDNPLESDGYRMLAEYFDNISDPNRSSLMMELANALDGDPNAFPRAPRLICSATDRAGLRHPALRGEAGELLALAGLALCRLYPVRGRPAGSRDEFRLDAGRGGQATAEALLTAVRILGLRAPEIYLSEENGPPFSLVYASAPRLLVGRLAVKRLLPDAELRFFAGRALFTQNPDLLALRSLSRDHLGRALSVLGAVLRGGKALTSEGRALREALPRKGSARLKELFESYRKTMDLQALAEGARHSANRAGLIVCGGVAPALAALKAKKALPSEVVELVRFAASERYLQLRSRRLGAG